MSVPAPYIHVVTHGHMQYLARQVVVIRLSHAGTEAVKSVASDSGLAPADAGAAAI